MRNVVVDEGSLFDMLRAHTKNERGRVGGGVAAPHLQTIRECGSSILKHCNLILPDTAPAQTKDLTTPVSPSG